MKLNFGAENNFLEFRRVGTDRIAIISSARDVAQPTAPKKSVVNTSEISLQEFIQLIESVGLKVVT